MLINFIIFGCIGLTLLGFWHNGHYGAWGKMVFSYKAECNQFNKESLVQAFSKHIDISFAKNGKIGGGFGATLHWGESGIWFHNGQIIRFFLPDIFIPWDRINNIKIYDYGFLRGSYTCIELTNNDYSIVIPKEVFNDVKSKLIAVPACNINSA